MKISPATPAHSLWRPLFPVASVQQFAVAVACVLLGMVLLQVGIVVVSGRAPVLPVWSLPGIWVANALLMLIYLWLFLPRRFSVELEGRPGLAIYRAILDKRLVAMRYAAEAGPVSPTTRFHPTYPRWCWGKEMLLVLRSDGDVLEWTGPAFVINSFRTWMTKEFEAQLH